MADAASTTGTVSASAALDEALEPSPFVQLRRRIFRHHSFLIGTVVILLIVGVAIFAPLLAPHDPYEQTLSARLMNPFWHQKKVDAEHPLGTDKVGRDYLSRLIHGARISLLIGFSTMLISGLIGTTLGVIAGYFEHLGVQNTHPHIA